MKYICVSFLKSGIPKGSTYLSSTMKKSQKSNWPTIIFGSLSRQLTKEDIWMSNKHMTRYSTSWVPRGMQITCTLRCHHKIQKKMAKHSKTENATFREEVRHWNSPTLLAGVEVGTTTLEKSLAVSNHFQHMFLLWPSDSYPRYIIKGNERYVHK